MTGDTWGFAEGEEIAAGIRCVQRLGGGPDNEVYLAWDEELYSLVVAKLLRPTKLDDEAFVRRFLRESDVLEALDHPVVVRLFGAVMDASRPMLLIEHLDGPSLGRLIRRHGAIDIAQLLPLALQICSALHYMHGKGYVHLDLKPDNIVMTSPPRLIDFSIARSMDEARKIPTPVGTDAYMAPEQCDPTLATIAGAADVWGFGATLYHAVTGRQPFGSRGAGNRFPQITEWPDPLSDEIPEVLRSLLFACLNRDPEARPTPAQAALALEPLVADLPRKPVLSPPKPRFQRRVR